MKKRRKDGTDGNPTLFEMGNPEEARGMRSEEVVARPYEIPSFYLGTSSFTASGWAGTFYPKGMKSPEYLAQYAKTFRCVEIDSSFYGTPAASTMISWYQKTPADFLFALKVPRTISHEKVLQGCDAELREFLKRVQLLNEKLGPLLLQFPGFNQYEFKTGVDFLERLRAFLERLPEEFRGKFAVEIRNRGWLDQQFLDALREHNVALAWTDTSFVPKPWEWEKLPQKTLDLITADFAYVRWLGNRKEIESITTNWERVVVDRTEDLKTWVNFLREMVLDKRLRKIFAFANNHYGGFAPATIQQFSQLWKDA